MSLAVYSETDERYGVIVLFRVVGRNWSSPNMHIFSGKDESTLNT